MNNLGKILLVSLIGTGILGCGAPFIEKTGDFDNDGIQDLLMTDGLGKRWIFLGNKDGSYLRLGENEHNHYEFDSDSGARYFINFGTGVLQRKDN